MSIKRTRPAGHRSKFASPDHQVTEPDHLARINALSKNARTIWFFLIAVLLFVGVTLLGFEHIDLYGYDRQTELPLIRVSVPTPFFLYAAPILVAANYVYFHLYLIRLWDALGEAPARVDSIPLGRVISPWLLTDAALLLRNWRRCDGCTDRLPLDGAVVILNFVLTWVFGLVVGTMTWWLSAAGRDEFMTGLAAFALTAMFLTSMASGGVIWQRMATDKMPERTID